MGGGTSEGGAAVAACTPEEALLQVWSALRDHYPMLEYAGCVGDHWVQELLPRVRAAGALDAAFPIIEELVLRLQDYHTRLEWPGPRPVVTRSPVDLGWVEGGVAVLSAEAGSGLRPGDRVLEVDGVSGPEAVRAVWGRAQGPTPDARRRSACRRLAEGAPGTTLRLRTERGSAELLRPEPRPSPSRRAPEPEGLVAFRPLEDAGVLRIAAWGGGLKAEAFVQRLDGELERARGMPALVIDVRGNPGGGDDLADACTGRFIEREVISSISFWRKPGTLTFDRSVEFCRPRGPWRYAGRVAVLIDEGCCSACEHFVSGMDASGTACLIGTPTSGACGLIRRIPLECGATLFCAMTFPLHGGVPSPLHGIEPHYRVAQTLADVRAASDGPLRVALAWLRSGLPLPDARNSTWE